MMNYFSEWLLNRFREGYALSRNPFYHDVVNRIELSPENIGVVEFCSKNYRPILPRLHEITDRFNCHFHYTITTYVKDIEPNVPSIDESIETQKELSAQVGNVAVAIQQCGGSHPTVWRVAVAIQQYGSCHTTTCQWARKRLKQRIGKSSFTIQQLAELALLNTLFIIVDIKLYL